MITCRDIYLFLSALIFIIAMTPYSKANPSAADVKPIFIKNGKAFEYKGPPDRFPAMDFDQDRLKTSQNAEQLMEQGRKQSKKGDFKESALTLQHAMSLFREKNDAYMLIQTAVQLAAVHQNAGYHKKALSVLKDAMTFAQTSEDRYANALLLAAISDVYLAMGNIHESVKYVRHGVSQARLSKKPSVLAYTLNNAGNVLAAEGLYDEALDAYEESLRHIQQAIADNVPYDLAALKSKSHINLVRVLFLRGDYKIAVTELEKAYLEIMKGEKDHNKAVDLISISLLAQEIEKKLADHRKISMRVYPLAAENKIPEDLQIDFGNGKPRKYQFNVFFGLGKYSLSLDAKLELEKMIRQIRAEKFRFCQVRLVSETDAVGVTRGRKDYSSNLELSKKRNEAVTQYILHQYGYKDPNIDEYGGLWVYSLLLGRYIDASQAVEAEQKIQKRYAVRTFVKEQFTAAGKHYYLYAGEFLSEKEAKAFCLATLGRDYPVKQTHYKKVSAIGDNMLIYHNAQTTSKIGESGRLTPHGRPEDRKVRIDIIPYMDEDIRRAVCLESDLGDALQMKGLQLRFAYRYNPDGKPFYLTVPYRRFDEIAHGALTESLAVSRSIGDMGAASLAYGYLARLEETMNSDVDTAIELTQSAVRSAMAQENPQFLYRQQWQLARLYRRYGRLDDAIDAYRSAVETLTPIRKELFLGYREKKDAFNSQVKPVYLELAGIYLDQAASVSDPVKQEAGLKQARDVMELLKSAEIQDFFEDECATYKTVQSVTIDRAAPHTAILYPICFPERLVLLMTFQDGMKQIQVPVEYKKLKETVEEFRMRLQIRSNNRFLFQAEDLYDWMIRPVEQDLIKRDIHTILVAPDGVLRLIPFSTLHDGNRFLVEKYAVGIIPSVTLVNPKPMKKRHANILICGLSDGVQGFTPLPSVNAELVDIQKIMGGKTVHKNQNYTLDNLKKEFKYNEYTIVHMATHGVFGGDPEETFLLTYDDRLTVSRLQDLLRFTRYHDQKVELLTLSACQTALGDERAALGLAGVAVKAGVWSVVATLWFVDDESTSLAVREFYRQLKVPGISKLTALQTAQKMLIHQDRYWHPLYWAPYVLIGNWM